MLAFGNTGPVSMARCQDVSEKGSVRPLLKSIKRRLQSVNADEGHERVLKRNLSGTSIDTRWSLSTSNEPRPENLPTPADAATVSGSSRVRNEDAMGNMSTSEYSWSNASTFCSAADPLNAALPYSRGRRHSPGLELGGSGIASGSLPLARTGSDLGHTGAWVDSEAALFDERCLHLDDESPEYRPEVPSPPDLGWLVTPHLSPLPSTFEFCYCCDDCQDAHEEDKINESLCLSRREEVDAQLEWALAYIEQRRGKADPSSD
ncbi:uncharacterized protein MAM_07440 [Metarhizium album ARSEF 1941]|uniref:Uncharacterized protein n=1 Tax=Metarhizium album (strain ARSEF 1941) TaxID=1081103 RepID=A0A0B2WNW3_METAS|nr:uncharacterized protein MAM_07440 [Metarhizium album ARSEF 1941]KHN94685.1 hypothetical protein MAM_07440 [Metarhizium album ARSEF 1941]